MMRHPIRPSTVLTLAVLLAASAAAAACPAANAESSPSGCRTQPAADFALADHAGQVVLLDFWASWCKPCRKSLPWLSELQRAYGDQGLRVVAVNVDKDEQAARAMMKDLDPAILVVMDPKGELAARYELEGMPSSFLIGRDGRVVASHVGFLASEADARAAEVAALVMAEAKPARGTGR